jgi:hypothetical protein
VRTGDFIQSQLLAGFRQEVGPYSMMCARLAWALLVGVFVSRRVIGMTLMVEAGIEQTRTPARLQCALMAGVDRKFSIKFSQLLNKI